MQKPRLVASDVDGTLLDPMERVTSRTERAIARVTGSGTPFVLVTGRPPRWIPSVADAAGLDGYAVCSNGAVLYDIGADQVLSATEIDPMVLHDVAHALQRVLPGMSIAVERVTASVRRETFLEHLGRTFMHEPAFSNPWGDNEHNVAPRAEVLGQPATKLLVRHEKLTSEEMVQAAVEVLSDAVDVTFSTSNGLIEISVRGVTKATGLSDVAERLGVDAASVIAFGDMPNDVEMLRWAGHGVAMANAHAEAMAVADEVTAPNSEDGVAQVLERWF
ncbi:hypothetical protein EV193_1011042 [Herbihabitans rhizosphaerae]|uniref:Cof subfamily protein (Haloacid dehalogenase superfamily)/HAD superfamily hydrolase (TIGR01484 family) n=1 Tax=Herbihabitans rhizosphaerae TaxID=1872711 RepID=A0A4Q7L704_9PSEU|nr:HAD family hydrolase [Herbihabitans rhizosphaerae]RZS45155.1 hypothetical protein EV193_1011042 [Herbihabitans rhizosphaerae]